MTSEEAGIVGYWGKERLYRWSSDVLASLAVPSECKWFMGNVGLPMSDRLDGMWLHRWDPVLDLEAPELGRRVLARTRRHCLFIGEPGGQIIWGAQVGRSECPLNSSVIKFAQSLTEYEKFLTEIDSCQVEGRRRVVEYFRDKLEGIDPDMMLNEHSYWSQTIFDMFILE